jgi:hypothetical protein
VVPYLAAYGVYESTMGWAYLTPGIPPDGVSAAFTFHAGAVEGAMEYLGLSSASLSE